MKIAFVISIILHIIILSIKIDHKQIPPPKQKKQAKIEIQLKDDKPKEPKGYSADGETLSLLNDIMNKIDSQFQTLREEQEKEKRADDFVRRLLNKCKDEYVGIGVHYSQLFQQITYVGPGTPADKAGFKVGDVFADPTQVIRNQYPKGTTIIVPITRNGIIMNIEVTVDEICSN